MSGGATNESSKRSATKWIYQVSLTSHVGVT